MRPRPYYGWLIVGTLAVTETVSWGIVYYAIAALIPPMERDLGWTRGQLSGAFSLALLVSAIAAVPAGRWLDRHGGRGLMTAGSLAATVLLVAWSRVHRLDAFYAIWAGLGLAMAAVLYEPAFAVIARWFVRQRTRALTIVTLAAGFASTIFLPLATWLVDRRGWRGALVTLAVLLGLTTVPLHALVLRRQPRDLGLERDGAPAAPDQAGATTTDDTGVPVRAALRSGAFWTLAAAFLLSAAATAVVGVHLIPHLIDRGFDPAFAAWVAGLVGAMQVGGRLAFGPLSARVPRAWVTTAMFLLQAIALGALPYAAGPAAALAFAALFGMGNGMITLARASRVAELFGTRGYGTLSGVIAVGALTARAAGPAGAGLLYDWLGSYTVAFWLLSAVTAAAAGCAWRAERAVR